MDYCTWHRECYVSGNKKEVSIVIYMNTYKRAPQYTVKLKKAQCRRVFIILSGQICKKLLTLLQTAMTKQWELAQVTSICHLAISHDNVYFTLSRALPEGCASPRSLNICLEQESGRNKDQWLFSKERGLKEGGEWEREKRKQQWGR